MPTIMKRRDPLAKESVDIQARALKRKNMYEESGRIHGKTKQELSQEQKIDDVFDVDENIEQDDQPNILEKFWDTLTE